MTLRWTLRCWTGTRALGAILLALLLAASARGQEPELRFVRHGELVASVPLGALVAACAPRTVEVDDPYYGRPKRFRACPLRAVLAQGFARAGDGAGAGDVLAALEAKSFLLRARDGFTRTAPGAQLLGPGGHLAFADAGREARGEPGWEPIDRRQVDPAPFYLIWTGPGQQDVHRFPWPYQLVEIEIARFEERFPHTVPHGAADGTPARRGYALFQRECVSCHAINGEGGTVGPELNVPQNILEYRPVAQVRAYIRDPAMFRHTSMPAHRHLSEADLDALVAYFRAMSGLKRDPGGAAGH